MRGTGAGRGRLRRSGRRGHGDSIGGWLSRGASHLGSAGRGKTENQGREQRRTDSPNGGICEHTERHEDLHGCAAAHSGEGPNPGRFQSADGDWPGVCRLVKGTAIDSSLFPP
jgi:hypothetical protein